MSPLQLVLNWKFFLTFICILLSNKSQSVSLRYTYNDLRVRRHYVCDECQKFFCTIHEWKRHQPYTPISKALVVVCVETIPNVQDQLERKVERNRTCIAPIVSISTTKRSDMDHTELPANTPHLPFLRISIR